MNPPYNTGPVGNQSSVPNHGQAKPQQGFAPQYYYPPSSSACNPPNSFAHGDSNSNRSFSGYTGMNSQNGSIDNNVRFSPIPNAPSVQPASMPPNTQDIHHQLSQDMKAMHLSQNQNHPVPQPGQRHPEPSSFQSGPMPPYSQNHNYWQQAPRQQNPGFVPNQPPNQFSSLVPPPQRGAAPDQHAMQPVNATPHQQQQQHVQKMPTVQEMHHQQQQYLNSTGYPPPPQPASQMNQPPPGPGSSMYARYPPGVSPHNNVSQNNVLPPAGMPQNLNQANSMSMQNRAGPMPPQPPPQQSRRLNPDDMPSPIQSVEDDRKQRSGPFSTAQRGLVPPLVSTNFTVVDEGFCSPRFMRSTIYNVPTTAEMLKQTSVPFALAISPFARLQSGEFPPPIVNPGEEGPVRCKRCRAYMSPFMQFVDAGRRFQCMLCKATSEVPMSYFTHLDHMGERVDKMERPELCLGSYEFIVNQDYCKEGKFPNCPAFIFLLDVSYNAIRCGMVKMFCDNIRVILESLPREYYESESNVRVGFITYSSVVHFYNISGNLAQPQMLVVSDVQDMFMPFLDGFLAKPSEAEQMIDSLMEQIPVMFRETRETETLLGPAIQAGLEALKAAECAGKLFVFHSSLPLAEAPGKLRNRDDRKLLGTDKEKVILLPQNTFYNNLAQECVKSGCSVDLFLFNNAYIDVATLGQVCRLTGGQLYKYTYFQADIDGNRFIEDLKKDIERPIVFDAVLRVRTSTGVRPTDFNGYFFMSNTTDVELASINCDSSLSIEIKYDDKLTEDEGVCIQCAVLFTSVCGQRRLRVHNLALNTCNQMAELYRSCELDTIMNTFLKDGVRRITEEVPKQVKDHFIESAAQILSCYRKNCAQASSAGQLILPECMKLLPLYINCLIKCDAMAGGQEITTDDRSFMMLSVLSMDVCASAVYLYPRLLPLHEIKPQLEEEIVPTALRCSVERLKENGAYLLENGFSMFLWIGMNVDPQWVQDIFGVPTIASIDIEKNSLLELKTPASQCLHKILQKIRNERSARTMKLYIVRQGDKHELLFRQLLVEDRTTEGSESYVDFLCHLHKEIRALLS